MTTPPTNPLHLLRALLRECTYLPDPNARKYLHNHILSSYRNYLPRVKEWRREIPLMRQVSLLSRGRQSLSLLQRANEGYPKPLHKILSWTYGRSGKRRRELMQKLMDPVVPENSETLENLTLATNQSEQVQYLGENKRKVRPTVVIPEKNIWGKDMPKTRVKNLTKKWYAKQTAYVFPPLPESERQNLLSLATGQQEWWPLPRRTRTGPASNLEVFEQQLQQNILNGPQKGHTFRKFVGGRPHALTDRYMRRHWAYIYKHVPTMNFFPETNKWKVFWHEVPRPFQEAEIVDADQETVLFGVPTGMVEESPPKLDAIVSV